MTIPETETASPAIEEQSLFGSGGWDRQGLLGWGRGACQRSTPPCDGEDNVARRPLVRRAPASTNGWDAGEAKGAGADGCVANQCRG